MKKITSDCKRAIYIGPKDFREHALSYGMTGCYDTVNEAFFPDGQDGFYQVPIHCFKLTEY